VGVGHPGHKDAVPAYVLRDFPKADAPWLDDLLRGVEDGAGELARQDWAGFQNKVALRLNPPRPGKPAPSGLRSDAGDAPATRTVAAVPGRPGEANAERPTEASTGPQAPRSPFQRLADRFR
jgi:PTH1 family peptidyl-tRNA hydrolase